MSVTACNVCTRLMRRKGARAADFPGTVSTHGRGMCATCYWRETHPESATKAQRAGVESVTLAGRGAPHTDEHNVLALADFLASRRARLAAQHRHLTRSTA